MNARSHFSGPVPALLCATLLLLGRPALAAGDEADEDMKDEPAQEVRYPSAKLEGRLQLRHDVFDGVYTDTGGEEEVSYLRRADIQLSGRFSKRLEYRVKGEFNDKDEVVLKTATLAWNLTKHSQLEAGHFKPEFGLEQTGSSSWSVGIERSAIWDLAPDIDDAENLHTVGLGFNHALKQVYLSLAGQSRSEGELWTARMAVAPIRHKRHVLHLGVSLLDDRMEGQDGLIRTRLGVRGVSVVDANGNRTKLAREVAADAFDTDRTGVIEFAYLIGPLSLQGEYLRRELTGAGSQADRTATGYYGQIAVTLTGEARNYRMNGARFSGVTPRNQRWGAVELFYRHDDLRTEGEPGMLKKKRDEGQATVDVVGLNWYVRSKVRLSANYLEAETDRLGNDAGEDEGKAASVQLQWLF